MKKIIDLPVIYEADVIPVGCRKNKIVNMIDYHPFEIEDLSDDIPELVVVSSNYKMQTIRKYNNHYLIPMISNLLYTKGKDTIDQEQFFLLEDEKKYKEDFSSFNKPRKTLTSILELTNENKISLKNNNFLYYEFDFLFKNIDIVNISFFQENQIKKHISDNKNKIIHNIEQSLKDYIIINNQFYKCYSNQPLLSLNPIDLMFKKVLINNNENSGLLVSLSMIDLINSNSTINQKIKILNPEAFDIIHESYISEGIVALLLKELNNINIYNLVQKNKSDDEIKCSKQIDQEILKLKGYNSTYNFNVVLKLAKQVDSLFDLMTQKTKLHYRTLKDKNIKPSLTLGNCFHDLTLSIQKIQEYLMKAEYNVKNI